MWYCAKCATSRKTNICPKCNQENTIADNRWIEPKLPDVEIIRKIARDHGYAIGEHGSKERDLDLIAVPWTENAIDAKDLISVIAKEIDATVLSTEKKAGNRLTASIQIVGYYKLIDLSVFVINPQNSSVELDPLRLCRFNC